MTYVRVYFHISMICGHVVYLHPNKAMMRRRSCTWSFLPLFLDLELREELLHLTASYPILPWILPCHGGPTVNTAPLHTTLFQPSPQSVPAMSP